MPETRLFVEPSATLTKKCVISNSVGRELGVKTGDMIRISDPDSKTTFASCVVELSNDVLDFSIKIASDLLEEMKFAGIEVVVEKGFGSASVSSSNPSSYSIPQPVQSVVTSQPSFSQYNEIKVEPNPDSAPISAQVQSYNEPKSFSYPPPVNQPMNNISNIPKPQPGLISGIPQPGSIPSYSSPPPIGIPPAPSGIPMQPSVNLQPPTFEQPPAPPVIQYPNKIDPTVLAGQKPGALVLLLNKVPFADGKAKLNQTTMQQLGLVPGMLIGWECPLTRSIGSARITTDNTTGPHQITMGVDTIEDTNLKSDQVVVYSTEPPIVHQDVLTLELRSESDVGGVLVNPRNAATLGVKDGDVLIFEDNLTGANGAAKCGVRETLDNKQVVIDSMLVEASGIGSTEVEIKKNYRQIIPLQSIDLGISPIRGEDIWQIISMARQNIESVKGWLTSYIIFKGIKLRWEAANVSCEVLNTVPDLGGDVFACITNNTTLNLKPTGLLTFNAVLIIDISRSMMAKDVEVKNIGPALEGIKAAMQAKDIKDFLDKFKPGIMVPRRYSAAFGAILFLSEKVGRGFGEKVSIIRFADEAQALTFRNGKMYIDSSAGEKDFLEDAARLIVDQIGNAYGQATNMGLAMLKAQELIVNFASEMPTMIVLLTDGIATDGDQFLQSVQMLSQNPNIVLYIIGLGNPDDEAMKRATAMCGGEYFKPNDSGELLIWYSKRARDLQVKLKGAKHT